MGLLDALNSRDGVFALGLLDAASAKPVRTSLGGGLLSALSGAQTWQTQQEEKQAREAARLLQEKMQQAQLQQMADARMQQQEAQAARQAAAQKQAAIEGAYRGAIRTPDMQAMAANGGPTRAAAQAVPGLSPTLDQSALIQGLMQADPMTAAQMLTPKPDELMTVAPGTSVISKRNPGKPLFTAPDKEAAPTELAKLAAERDKLPIGHQLRSVYDAAINKATTHTPGTTVSVNTGQKGFDNTLKLRGDFRSEPIYKAHQEVQSAHAQITQALKSESPAGDLAGATKIMKILDPGSVVRESELGMAMAATGLADRLSFYVQNVMNGTKLNPNQRKDFQQLADRLFNESTKMYSTKQSEYGQIAKRNGLTVEDVIGAPAMSGEWSMVKVK